jgi:hypothetical protein
MPVNSSTANLGITTIAPVATMISTMLCGGMFAVMPTALPVEPFINRFGSADGRTVG